MPWKECKPMDERLKFILYLAERESILRLFVTVRSYSSLFPQSPIDKGLQSLIALYCPLLFVYDRSIMYVT